MVILLFCSLLQVLEWPAPVLDGQGTVEGPSINSVVMSQDLRYLVALSDKNMVVIWKKTSWEWSTGGPYSRDPLKRQWTNSHTCTYRGKPTEGQRCQLSCVQGQTGPDIGFSLPCVFWKGGLSDDFLLGQAISSPVCIEFCFGFGCLSLAIHFKKWRKSSSAAHCFFITVIIFNVCMDIMRCVPSPLWTEKQIIALCTCTDVEIVHTPSAGLVLHRENVYYSVLKGHCAFQGKRCLCIVLIA